MKTKTIQIKTRIDDDSVFAIQDLIELMSEGENAELDIYLDDLEKNRMSVCYEFEGSEINETFTDREVCEDYFAVQSSALESGKLYECKANIVSTQISEDGKYILFDVEIPLLSSEAETPQVAIAATLPKPKEVVFKTGTPELQKYSITIVGILHHATDAAYDELTRLSRSNGTIILRQEPDNEEDPQAIAAYLTTGEKVGYVATQHIPVCQEAAKTGQLSAQLTYMEHNGASATALMKFESGTSVMAVQLFSRYSPADVYKATYLYFKWGGILENEESQLFETLEESICLDRFFALDISDQNQQAEEWEHRLLKATVENPTNPGRRMSVPLLLSAYATSWQDLDLSDNALIDRMEQDNKIVALYFRYRRTESGGMMVTPKEFVDEVAKVTAGEALMKRLVEVFEKKMS